MVLDGSPLPTNSSIRDFQNEKAGYVADAVEQSLLLPEDMVDLRTLKKHEVFLSLKKDLAMVSLSSYVFFFSFLLTAKFPLQAIPATFKAKELVDISHRQMKDEEGRRVATVEAFKVAEKRLKESDAKLTKAERGRKSTEVALDGVERQAKTQCK